MSDNKVYWVSRDGVKHDIDEMSIHHLRNALKMVVRQIEANRRKHLAETEARSQKLKGDMAQHFNEQQDRSEEVDGWQNW